MMKDIPKTLAPSMLYGRSPIGRKTEAETHARDAEHPVCWFGKDEFITNYDAHIVYTNDRRDTWLWWRANTKLLGGLF